ncbi:MAG: histidine kinase [Bacteroidales bacterium]|nr:histidine kinase [Bacteroidales bacterium]MBN2749837.1 histidine kinase [Bacteroidales bacterium]
MFGDDNKTVLFVDDEKHNLLAFKATFREHFVVYTAQSAAEALSLLAEHGVKVVISDQRMPETTGVEFLEQVQALYPDTIRILLTAYSDFDALIDAVNKGKIYYYLSKPWNTNALTLVLENAFESLGLREKNRELEREAEHLRLISAIREKELLLSQLENLKNQIKPHFLFNALGSLVFLIEDNPTEAVEFVRRLSSLYRFLIEISNNDLVSIERELKSVGDYIYLQQTRFSGNLIYQQSVPHSYLLKRIPSSGVLMLVENAIKHNVVTSSSPLTIRVTVKNNMLVVSNNINPRVEQPEGTGTGLKNLSARYDLLIQKKPQIIEASGMFEARLPIL